MSSIIFQFNSLQLLIIIFCISIVQFLLSNWIKSKLEKSIQHEYDKKIEEYKFLQVQRQKAEVIAKFFSRWIKYRGQERVLLNKDELINYYEDLNKMSFELSLWISDNKILEESMKLFSLKADAKNVRELTAEFRKFILGKEHREFDIQQIVIWPTDQVAEEIGLINKNK